MSKLKGMFREFDQFNFDLIKDLSELIFNESHKKKKFQGLQLPFVCKNVFPRDEGNSEFYLHGVSRLLLIAQGVEKTLVFSTVL